MLASTGFQAADPLTLESALRQQTLEINAELEGHARIACIILTGDDWSMDNGLMTHTMKIKRAALEKKYSELADRVFSLGASLTAPLVIREENILSELT